MGKGKPRRGSSTPRPTSSEGRVAATNVNRKRIGLEPLNSKGQEVRKRPEVNPATERPSKSERSAARKNPTPPPKPINPYVGYNPNVSRRQMGGRISSLSYGGDSIAYRRGQGPKY